MNEQSATEIANWVKQGGVLLIMTNDNNNCDLKHLIYLLKNSEFILQIKPQHGAGQ
jgi:hypothetical protein